MMKKSIWMMFCIVAVTVVGANAGDFLEGDTRLACEAILCLSSGQRPHECQPSLRRYFGIHKKKLSDTIKARRNFLKLCPSANADTKMQSLTSAIARGAGQCDAASLNKQLRRFAWDKEDSTPYILNRLPIYCAEYYDNGYTDIDDTYPMYVGEPDRGGHWVAAKDYDAALWAYNDRIQKEDEERQRQAKEEEARRWEDY